MRGKNLSGLEVTPAMIHVRHATKIASEVTEGQLTSDGVSYLPHPSFIIVLRQHHNRSLFLFTTFFSPSQFAFCSIISLLLTFA